MQIHIDIQQGAQSCAFGRIVFIFVGSQIEIKILWAEVLLTAVAKEPFFNIFVILIQLFFLSGIEQ